MNAVMGIKERKISIIIQCWAIHEGLMLLSLDAAMYQKLMCVYKEFAHFCLFSMFLLL